MRRPRVSRLSIFAALALALACHGRAMSASLPPVPWDAGKQGNFVTALCGDLQGQIWIATEDNGVWRYTPSDPSNSRWTQFTASTTNGGLGDDDIYSLTCDRLGRVWCGTGRDGVSVFNGKTWKTYDRLTGPPGCHVTALATTPLTGDVWGCTESGLFRYTLKTGTWQDYTRADGLPSDQADSLAFGSDGTLYVATLCDGIAIASPQSNYHAWRVVRGPDALPDTAVGDGLPTSLINCLLVARDGNVYAGTTTGLALSGDRGRTWRFLRGADWKDKLAGLNHPISPKDNGSSASLLGEDYVTALAEDGAGNLYIGHRQKGLEVYDKASAKVTPSGNYGGYANTLFATSHGNLLIGTYGDGLTETTCYAAPIPPVISQVATAISPLPRPAAPPTADQVTTMLRQVQSSQGFLTPGQAVYVSDDWNTLGDWVGSYGTRQAVFCACQAPIDHLVVADDAYQINGKIGPYCDKGDGLRHWVEWLDSSDSRVLFDPIIGHRREAEWDDHGEAYSTTREGPDIRVTVSVPAGLHRLSLYFFNKDGHDGPNRDRDYLVQIKPYRKTLSEATSAPTLAQTRVASFWGGVYKQFALVGPGAFEVQVRRNYSHNTILQAVFLDKISGPPTRQERERVFWYTALRFVYPDLGTNPMLQPNWHVPKALSTVAEEPVDPLRTISPPSADTNAQDKANYQMRKSAQNLWNSAEDVPFANGRHALSAEDFASCFEMNQAARLQACRAVQNSYPTPTVSQKDGKQAPPDAAPLPSFMSLAVATPQSVTQTMLTDKPLGLWRWRLHLWWPVDRLSFDTAVTSNWNYLARVQPQIDVNHKVH